MKQRNNRKCKHLKFIGRLSSSGITLVELLTVIAIIGILAAVAIPSFFSWLPNIRLKSAAQELYANMQKAKMLAIKNNRDHSIVFVPGADVYRIVSEGVTILTVNLGDYGGGIGYGHGNVPAGKSATSPPDAFPGDNVSYASDIAVFNPQGTGSAGYVYLHNADGTAYAIGTQSSGAVLLKKWMGGVWK